MIVKTLFLQDGLHRPGFVEVKLLPGIPHLHIVGLPDAAIRECGIKIKSALRSAGLAWPAGQQIVVSLRPSDVKKSSAGVELAIAMAYLALSEQLAPSVRLGLEERVVYGELALNGDVCAPSDLEQALRSVSAGELITGRAPFEVRDGKWFEFANLRQDQFTERECVFDWNGFWARPMAPVHEVHEAASLPLLLTAHMGLTVLVAGPQGTGKSTWARILHSLLPPPDQGELVENARLFGEEVFASRWRPIENPHHTLTPLAMIGGGHPLEPGVISRAHGGVLLMDEFLEFHPQVLEALREPIERGRIELARVGLRQTFPARFHLVATTNLCVCGKLNPMGFRNCSFTLSRCRSTLARLSGPMLDRFDLMSLSHQWTGKGGKVSMEWLHKKLRDMDEFRKSRAGFADDPEDIPGWLRELPLGYRRWKSVQRVARGLADMDASLTIESRHFNHAYEIAVTPMQKLREIFG